MRDAPQPARPETIRVLLAEDHTIVREGLRALLAAEAGLRVVGEAATGIEAVERARALAPDVVVMDLGLPGLHGADAIDRIVAETPDTRVLVLSMHAGPEYVRPALRAGARGYLVKGAGLSDLVSAIRAVHRGDRFMDPALNAIDLDGDAEHAALTPREREVLRFIAEGCSSADIADRLGLSVKTIETHRGHMMRKLGASNVAGLVRHAIRLRLVDG